MGVCHAVLGSLLALRGPPPTGLFPLLAALLPLALSSYPLLRFRTMEVAARLLQKQLASLAEGGPVPEATRLKRVLRRRLAVHPSPRYCRGNQDS